MMEFAFVYIAIVAMVGYLAFSWVKDCKRIEDWNYRTENYIDSLNNRITELNVRVRKLEHDLGESVIEPEPDFSLREVNK